MRARRTFYHAGLGAVRCAPFARVRGRPMPIVRSFAPLARADARVLILGSMPGEASLAAGRYYAHPRNAFWPLLGAVLEVPADADHDARVQALLAARIAVWDVLHSCEREGSLDSDIARDGRRVNAFAPFFAAHPALTTVLCNGGTAHRLFTRLVLPRLERAPRVVALPSTSPAHASRSFAAKLAVWRAALLGDDP